MSENIVYVVTGSTGPLGGAFLDLIDAPESHVLAVAHRQSLPRLPRSVQVIDDCDLTNYREVKKVRDYLEGNDSYASSEIRVINCAGKFPYPEYLGETDPDAFADTLNSNVLSVFNIARVILPLMAQRRGGKFVSFTSHTTAHAFPFMGAFNAAKAAVESLTRTIANEYGEFGVVAMSFALATLDTPAERKLKPNGDVENWIKPSEAASYVLHTLNAQPTVQNGNNIHLYKHSKSFFHDSYYKRIERE